jgi:hypothetical protein
VGGFFFKENTIGITVTLYCPFVGTSAKAIVTVLIVGASMFTWLAVFRATVSVLSMKHIIDCVNQMRCIRGF